MMATNLKTVAQATVQREKAEREWRQSIVDAATAGPVAERRTLRAIAEVAGVSHTRVHQIIYLVKKYG